MNSKMPNPIDPLRYFSVRVEGQFVRGTCYLVDADAHTRRPTVIICHGFAGQRTGYAFMLTQIARALNEAGIHAVTFDYRGYAESDGLIHEIMPTQQLMDVAAVMRWAGGQLFVDQNRLGLLGYSLGGLYASCSLNQTPRVKALGMISPTTVPHTRRFLKEAENEGSVTFGPHHLYPSFFKNLATLAPAASIKQYHPPAIIVHGDSDTRVPAEVSEFYRACYMEVGGDIQYELVPHADHGYNRSSQREILRKKLIGFFTRVL